MTVKIKKIGGRLVIPIPLALLRKSGLIVGASLHGSTRDGAIVLRNRRRRSLAKIVAQIDSRSYERHDREFA